MVDALGGSLCCPARRALVLLYVYDHPGSHKNSIAEHFELGRGIVSRDVVWLIDQGCVIKKQNNMDRRENDLFTCGFAQKNVEYALGYCQGNCERLIFLVEGFISLFDDHKPTMRDLKILGALSQRPGLSRKDIDEELFDDNASGVSRALSALLSQRMIERDDEKI